MAGARLWTVRRRDATFRNMNILLIIVIAFFLIVWVMLVASQVGYFKPLGKKLVISGWRIHVTGAEKEVRTPPQVSLGDSPNDTCQPAEEAFARRSLVEKSRPLVVIALLFGLCGALVAVALFVLAARFHLSTLFLVVGLIIEFLLLIFTQAGVTGRYLMKIVSTTCCPCCGQLPMRYVEASKDERRLLVCAQCHIEWDLGPAD